MGISCLEEEAKDKETFQPWVEGLEPLRAAFELWLYRRIKGEPEIGRKERGFRRQLCSPYFVIDPIDLTFCVLQML